MFKSLLLGICIAASAAGCTSMRPQPYGADAPREAYVTCVRSTGSRIIRKDHDCLPVAGRSYSRNAILGTGASTTAGALSSLDPSLGIGH